MSINSLLYVISPLGSTALALMNNYLLEKQVKDNSNNYSRYERKKHLQSVLEERKLLKENYQSMTGKRYYNKSLLSIKVKN